MKNYYHRHKTHFTGIGQAYTDIRQAYTDLDTKIVNYLPTWILFNFYKGIQKLNLISNRTHRQYSVLDEPLFLIVYLNWTFLSIM